MKRSWIWVSVLAISIFTVSAFAETEKKDPVSFRKIIKFLVDIDGYEGQKPTGQNISMGEFKASEAKRKYKGKTGMFEIKIADYSYYPMMKKGFEMMGNFEVDSTEKMVKKIKVGDFTAVLEINFERKEGKLIIFLDNSILIILEGDGLTEKDLLLGIIKNIDLKGLNGLK